MQYILLEYKMKKKQKMRCFESERMGEILFIIFLEKKGTKHCNSLNQDHCMAYYYINII